MGLEQNIERIADALDRIAVACEGNREARDIVARCAEFHARRAGMTDVVSEASAPTAPVREETASADPGYTYEELKAKLIERGIGIAKGTKMTTLLKLWDAHKDDPVVPAEPVEVVEIVGVVPAEPAELVEPVEIVEEAPAEVDPFDVPTEPAKPTVSDDLTLEEARAIIERNYDRSEADRDKLVAAYAEAGQGIAYFGDIPVGKHGAVVRKYLELKGVTL